MFKSLNNWLSRIDKDAKEERESAVFRLWLASHTQEEIANAVGMPMFYREFKTLKFR